MRSLKGWIILLVIMLFPVLALSGQTKEKENQGFFGSILLGGGVAAGKPSGLKVTDDNKKISSLNKRKTGTAKATPVKRPESQWLISLNLANGTL